MKRQFVIVLCGIGLVTWASPVQAAFLSSLFAGGSISAGSTVFDNWQLEDLALTNGAVADFTQMEITPVLDSPYDPGFRFDAKFNSGDLVLGTPATHTGPSSVHLVISFDVHKPNGPFFAGDFFSINGYMLDSGPAGVLSMKDELYDSLGVKIAEATGFVNVGDASNDPDHVGTASYDKLSFLHVVKTIDITAPADNQRVWYQRSEQRFALVPEPGTFLLLALSLMGLLSGRRVAIRQ